jgi:hypothetical protein
MNAVTTTTAAATDSTSGVILPSQSNADPTENGSIEIPNLIMTFIEEVNILEIIYFLFFNWSLV